MKTLCAILTTALVLILGCNREEVRSDEPLAVMPFEGATSIKRDANITLTFDKPVNPATLEKNFHLMTYQDMEMILDSMMSGTSMMTMDSCRMDSMMTMMDSVSMMGKFTWNQNNTECVFDPDSLMMTNREYTVHLGREMMQSIGMNHGDGMMSDDNENMMGGMMDGTTGGMMGNESGMDGDMMIRFTTGDAVEDDSGDHDSHH
ncbi:Ig-like domain-containing protein [bacterium]|nr:Ig-like domain-containing protein [bacterium]